MDQEYLTPAEQHQLEQEFHSTQQDESTMGGEQHTKPRAVHVEERREYQQPLQHSGVQPQQPQGVQTVQEGDAPPDPQKDFMGYMQWLGKTLHQQGLLHAKQQAAVPEAEQLQNFFQQSVASVKQKYHDFDQAADFIYETRAKQLAAFASLYPEMADPKAIDEVIGNELKQILRDCAQKNQNPAEMLYTLAQKNGYTNVSNPMGIPNYGEGIKYGGENLQERQNSARTLAAYNGLTSSGPISLEMLDKMTEAEFSSWVSEPKNKAAFNRLMGGGDL
ncbi:hypothetical protein [Bartonella vinsonii]|uniref:Phage protein n=1 Tax=Bartonella vinsonii subsp. berkhoffii str. Tweed TaxID=1094502 RepID=N6VT89_BARVB|nr:hypothetical protein [Bartonella vinsonii]AGF76353.1 hypothetical protein BVwin_12720 [Bartonella vinsonii subsp. berkhoffii str. Winnie]ENN94287.1 hypothetical protein BVtw_13690 [Bartonella vinsonii subsp. berkhoffii str. Tweed]